MFRRNLSRIVYLSVFLGVVLPAGAAWVVLVRPTRPPTWVPIVVACAVGTAIELLANVAERIVERRSERKTAARAKPVTTIPGPDTRNPKENAA
ncbi:hypothetical protein OH809_45435 (plasmid) [Streptomyces sp. NBC_00873]|uniref:hypothetical protein n=1 Tax=unclassified Streptomyces TaxID=2593676 RepID=UPI002F91561B|nr:hypothetical protein OH809_45435 [Streptomyces sp. NBC_00873]WTA49379.1 hypothetical protein OH821_45480 [Streptomyces sp. NBC_00842]